MKVVPMIVLLAVLSCGCADKNELDRSRKRIAQLNKQLETYSYQFQNSIADLKKQLYADSCERDRQEREITKLQQQLDSKNQELQSQKALVESMSQTLVCAQSSVQQFRDREGGGITNLQQQLDSKNQELQSQKALVESMSQTLVYAQSSVQQLPPILQAKTTPPPPPTAVLVPSDVSQKNPPTTVPATRRLVLSSFAVCEWKRVVPNLSVHAGDHITIRAEPTTEVSTGIKKVQPVGAKVFKHESHQLGIRIGLNGDEYISDTDARFQPSGQPFEFVASIDGDIYIAQMGGNATKVFIEVREKGK